MTKTRQSNLPITATDSSTSQSLISFWVLFRLISFWVLLLYAFLWFTRALAYADKAVLFYVQLYEIVDVYNRFEKFSNLI